MRRNQREEKRDFLNLTWLNHQYYDLGRSFQDIADDQGVSMMTIRKWVDKIERPISEKKEKKPRPSPISKIEDFLRISIKICPHCGQKLSLKAIFCIKCGKKVEEDQEIPSISDRIEDTLVSEIPQIKAEQIQLVPSISDTKGEKIIAEIPSIKDEEVQPSPSRWKEKLAPEIPDLKVEKIQPTPLIKKKKEESKVIDDSLTEIEEKQPVPPILDIKEEKPKVIPYFCKFCGMKLNKKATFCPQCGTKVKKK